ncbi:MAG: ABC transporter substrate-binding protein [Roseibium sp.]
MTGFRTFSVAAICAGLFLAVNSTSARAQDPLDRAARTLTFAADEWCPVNCEPGSDRPGYMVEIVKAILEPEGYEVRYVTLNWARALLLARSGRFDGVFGALHGDAPDFIFPSEPQGTTEVGLFVRKSSDWAYTSGQSLQDRSVGLIRGYAYGEELEALIAEKATASYAGGDKPLELNMLQLQAERIDIVVEDVNIFRHTARELGLQQEFRLAKAFSSEGIYVAFSPNIQDGERLAELMGSGMATLRASGRLQAIMARYGLDG